MVRVKATHRSNPDIEFTILCDGTRIYDVDESFAVLSTEDYADIPVNTTSDLSRLNFRLEVISFN